MQIVSCIYPKPDHYKSVNAPTIRTAKLPGSTSVAFRALIARGDRVELSDYLVNTLRDAGVGSTNSLLMSDERNALHGAGITPDIAGLEIFLRVRRVRMGLPRYRRANLVALFAYLMSRGHLG